MTWTTEFGVATVIIFLFVQTKSQRYIECKFPPEAITVNRTGQKAWDKCIDLADSVYPCVPHFKSATKVRHLSCHRNSTNSGDFFHDKEFAHMAALGFDESPGGTIDQSCSGALISDQWVLTSAHCTKNKYSQVDVKYVRLTAPYKYETPKPVMFINVIQIVKHPEYTSTKIHNDIALLKLDKVVNNYNRDIRPACLHVGNAIKYETAIATSWRAGKSTSNELIKSILRKYSYETCRDKILSHSEKFPDAINNATQICYGDETKLECTDDSGGLLQNYNDGVYCTFHIIGIEAVDYTCEDVHIPKIYTRVSAYVPWIESVVWPN